MTTFANGQFYRVVINSSQSISNLNFVSLDDSTLTMRDAEIIYEIPVASVTRVYRREPSSSNNSGTDNKDLSFIRGVVGGVICGPGIVMEALGLTPIPDDVIILPDYVYAGIFLVGTIGSVWGFDHYARNKFWTPNKDKSKSVVKPNFYNLRNQSFTEKYRQLEIIFVAQNPLP